MTTITTFTRDKNPRTGGIQTRNSSKELVADLRLAPLTGIVI
jgi:hypothetical protein